MPKTAEEWSDFESQLATDPRNLALCVAHRDAAKGQCAEWFRRALALRATARTKTQFEPRDLEGRQILRWKNYKQHLKKLRDTKQAQKAKQHRERERLRYILACLKTGAPIRWN